jgi:hypothetical protein
MKGGPQAAMALAVGYLLGRRHKLRTATMMAGGMAVGAVGGLGGMALKRGAKVLGNTEMLGKVSPQLTEVVDAVRNDLLDAGKAAAMAAVSGRIDSLTDTLHDRAEILRNPVDTATDEVGKTADRAGKTAGRAGKAAGGAAGRLRRRGRQAEDDEAVEAEDDEGAPLDDELDEEEEPRDERDELDDEEEEPRRRGEADLEDEDDEGYEADDEAEDVADDEDAAEPGDEDEPEPRPRRSRPARTKSPVSRTRR